MEAPTILFCRSEECSALELSPIHPTKGGKSLQALLPPSQSTVACFAYELEQDIAALEAEASWDDVHLWDTSVADDTCARLASVRDQSSSMGQRQLTVCQASDNDSEINIEGEATASEKVQANAKMVAECGRPLEHGAWKGCAKSAWCDREDRHRGLCNHKASIPGPAAASVPATQGYISCQQHSQVPDNMMDSSSVTPESSGQADKLQYAAGSDQQGYTGKLQHSMDTCSMHSECPSDQAVEEHAWREVSSAPELLWSSGASQQQQLLAIPLIYQPLVKDLVAPGIGSFLTADGFCCMQETLDVPVPVVQPVTQAVHMDSNDDSSRSCTVAEDASGRQCSGSELACSSPSSPTCSSEAASMLCYDAVSAAQLPNMCSKQPPQVSGPLVHQETPLSANPSLSDFRMAPDIPHGLLPLREVHPVDVTAQQPSAAPAVSTGAEKPMLPRLGSSHSQLSQSGVDSSERDSGTQSGAASESPDAINSVVEISAAAKSAAAAAQVPSMQRAARIKVKPRRADEPPRQLLEPSSPKSKKRAASRTVLQPSAGHCCTQCGAVSTPVWRAGPAGPKTLCNACGVRYMKVARRSR